VAVVEVLRLHTQAHQAAVVLLIQALRVVAAEVLRLRTQAHQAAVVLLIQALRVAVVEVLRLHRHHLLLVRHRVAEWKFIIK